MGVCCRIRLCCDDNEAAVALATDEEISLESAEKIIAGYQLVPLSPPPPAPAGPGENEVPAEAVAAGAERLAKLHAHIRNELRAILTSLGHEAGEEN